MAMQSRFEAKKQNILKQLNIPDEEYHDLSPKGSVDEPIRFLIDNINRLDGLVTTSSCSGRVSVYLEGRKKDSDATEVLPEIESSRAGPGGKGGGAWLYISHSPIQEPQDHMALFGFNASSLGFASEPVAGARYIHLKFEPMILHILAASLDDSQRVLTAALSAGFRESGAVSLSSSKNGESNPMVAVRSMGYAFDSIIGYQNEQGKNIPLVDDKYLRLLVGIANERFSINMERIERFRSSLLNQYKANPSSSTGTKPDWEDADARRQRKREEGLARRRELLQAQNSIKPETKVNGPEEGTNFGGMFD